MKNVGLWLGGLCLLVCGTPSEAKQYATCDAAHDFYLRDKSPHKAFATTNGILPHQGIAMCGGGSGTDLSRVISVAVSQCNNESKKAHISGTCKVIEQK